jgi:hypothetical protein
LQQQRVADVRVGEQTSRGPEDEFDDAHRRNLSEPLWRRNQHVPRRVRRRIDDLHPHGPAFSPWSSRTAW